LNSAFGACDQAERTQPRLPAYPKADPCQDRSGPFAARLSMMPRGWTKRRTPAKPPRVAPGAGEPSPCPACCPGPCATGATGSKRRASGPHATSVARPRC